MGTSREPFHVSSSEFPGGVRLDVRGEIALAEATQFRAAIKEAQDRQPKKLVINLAGVGYMNTPGLAALVEALQVSRKTNRALALTGLSEKVRAVFEMARLTKVFSIYPSAAEAEQAS
ncbi:MAG: STAS domain-containing protein [Planctomycetota bacterium]|nr:STAS domain-containing protein [Planctomycetota bacterium]